MRIRRAVLGLLAAGALSSSGAALANALSAVTKLSIQPQTVASALLAFSDQTKVQVVSVGSEVRGRRSLGVEGELSAREALTRLLEGTGLRFELINEQTVRVFADASKQPAQRAINLSQATEGAGTSLQTNASSSSAARESTDDTRLEVITVFGRTEEETVREVPQSVMVFDKAFIENTGAIDLYNVLRFVPSAANRRTQNGYLPEEYNIRGFYAASTFNGTSRSTMTLDMQGVERVEVLMGPASVLYGSMEPGAVVNLVTKRPLDQFHWSFGAGVGSYDNYRVTTDVGGPLSDRIRARLNVAYQDRESFLDYWSANKLFVAPSIAFDLGERTQLVADVQYSRERAPEGAYVGSPAAGLLTANPFGDYSRSFFIASPDEPGVGMDRKATRVALELTHQFTDTWHGRAAFSHTADEQNSGYLLSQGFLNNDYRTLRRYFFIARDSETNNYSYHMDVSGEFATGPLSHKFSVGAEFVHQRSDFRAGRGGFFTTSVDIFDPSYTATLPATLALNGSLLEEESQGVFIQDRVSVMDRLHLIGGVRFAEIRTSNTFTPAATGVPQPPTVVSQNAWPTLFGVLYDVTDSVTVFANQSKSFIPRGGTTQGGASFAPERSVQYELGTKFDIGSTGLNGSVALFHVEKPNVLTVDLSNPGFQVPLGKVTSKGAEVSVQGHLLPNWSMYASYAYTDTEVESNTASLDGNRLSHSPGDTFSLMTRYDFQSGLLAGFGVSASTNFVASRYIDDGNNLLLPSYTRVDLGVYYTISERADVSVQLNNATDEDIFSGSGLNLVELDLPRNFMARINFKM